MNKKYVAILLVGVLVAAGLAVKFCSTGEAPEGFDPTVIESE